MFRSIQGKLVIVYLLLVLVAMQLSMVIIRKGIESAYVQQAQARLLLQAQLLVGYLSTPPTINKGKLDEERVRVAISNWPGDVLVLDANSIVIGATNNNRLNLGKKFTNYDISPALIGTTSQRVEPEERMAYVALPILSANNVVGVVYQKDSLESAYNSLSQVQTQLLYAWTVALVVTVALGVALSRTITGPVRELTRRAAEIAGGNFDQTIRVRSGDEIGQLGEMFNRMTRRLKQTLEEIQGEKHKVEAILSHMADGLLALDGSGRMIKLNPAAQRMFQTPEEEVLGRLPADIWPEVRLEAALEQARLENRSLTQEIRFGSLVLLAHITPLKGDSHQVAGTVVVFHDITELEKLEAMRREFVANVSHELKTPLTTVKSYVETLLDGAAEDTEVRARFLRVVEGETDRMARLVKDLLHLSQLDQGAANWDVQSYEVGPLVEECVARLSVQAERKKLKLSRTVQLGTPPGMFDRDKLQQVLVNLLANAIEFTPAGGEIRVDVRSDGAMVRVSVKDSGIGIPREDLPRIFERFYRVDKARSRMLGGTGLGLAIARQIVELLGGAISIESQLGRGTEVIFTIPAAQLTETRWS